MNQPEQPNDTPELVTIDTAAALFTKPTRTIRHWLQRGYLRTYRDGDARYVDAGELRDLLAAAAGEKRQITGRVAKDVADRRSAADRVTDVQHLVQQKVVAQLRYLTLLEQAVALAEQDVAAVDARLASLRDDRAAAAAFLADCRRELEDLEDLTVAMSSEYVELLVADDGLWSQLVTRRARSFERRHAPGSDVAGVNGWED